VVVDAYSQLAAEGYLELRQGARPRVSEAAMPRENTATEPGLSPPVPRFDLRPRAPDVSSFPHGAWLSALRDAVASIADGDLLYGIQAASLDSARR
jgi:GntR family transcriptional regulator/MocR family aminotransferase